ncbi:Rhs-related transmembrane protein, YD repeat protein, partial [Burkholderia stabilis]
CWRSGSISRRCSRASASR